MRIFTNLILFFFLSQIVVKAQETTLQEAFEFNQFTSETGGILPYRLLKPQNYNPEKKYPLVVFLHGSGERGNDNKSQLKNAVSSFLDNTIREKYPAFILAPQCPEGDRWSAFNQGDEAEKFWLSENPTESMKLLLELINYTKESFKIDERRLYATGLSMGGHGTYDMLIRNPDMFAAAVVVCSFTDVREVNKLSQTPLWIFHGEDDQVVPVDNARVLVQALDITGVKPKYTEYEATNHNSWDKAFAEEKMYSWLFKKRL